MELQKAFSDTALAGQREDWEGGPNQNGFGVGVELWLGENVVLLHLRISAPRDIDIKKSFRVRARSGNGNQIRVKISRGWNILELSDADSIQVAVASLNKIFDEVYQRYLSLKRKRDEVSE